MLRRVFPRCLIHAALSTLPHLPPTIPHFATASPARRRRRCPRTGGGATAPSRWASGVTCEACCAAALPGASQAPSRNLPEHLSTGVMRPLFTRLRLCEPETRSTAVHVWWTETMELETKFWPPRRPASRAGFPEGGSGDFPEGADRQLWVLRAVPRSLPGAFSEPSSRRRHRQLGARAGAARRSHKHTCSSTVISPRCPGTRRVLGVTTWSL